MRLTRPKDRVWKLALLYVLLSGLLCMCCVNSWRCASLRANIRRFLEPWCTLALWLPMLENSPDEDAWAVWKGEDCGMLPMLCSRKERGIRFMSFHAKHHTTAHITHEMC